MIVPPKKINTWGCLFFCEVSGPHSLNHTAIPRWKHEMKRVLFCPKVAEAEEELRKLQDMNEGH